MIVTLFPKPEDQARAFGVFSFIASGGAAIGLLAGGLITQAVSWHWIFFVNLPIGAATALVAWRLLDSDRGIGLGRGADFIGAGLVTAALMLGVYTIVQSEQFRLGSVRTLALGGVSLALLVAFLVRQAYGRNPILPLRLFGSRIISGANLIQILMVGAFFSFFFLGSLDFQRVLGYGPLRIGLAFLPVAVVMGAFSVRFSAWLINRFGARSMLLTGQGLIAAGLLLLGLGPTHSDYMTNLLVPLALLGLGGGLTFPALTIIAMSDTAPRDSGLASGLLNTSGQVGGALGLAVFATVAGTRTVQLGSQGLTTPAALAGGYHLAWLLGAGIVVATIAMAAILLRGQPSSEQESAEDDEAAA
jgi:MFS family permease